MYHRNYNEREPVEITIEPNRISILNHGGPDRSIPLEVVRKAQTLRCRKYRNRRLGDFLKEMELTEGCSTGIPTVQEELQKNGSPRAVIETNDELGFISVFIPTHEGCGERVVLYGQNDTKNDTKNDTIKLTVRQRNIIELIKDDDTITLDEMTLKMSVSRSSITMDLSKLQSNGFITRQGSRRVGRWIVLK